MITMPVAFAPSMNDEECGTRTFWLPWTTLLFNMVNLEVRGADDDDEAEEEQAVE
jgi:hypothetical protein